MELKFPMTEEEAKRYFAERAEALAMKPVKSRHAIATLGAKTERGGEVVTASTGDVINGHRIACVGDTVRYPDGSESKIVSGAGSASLYDGNPVAIVGSHLENGDIIVGSLQNGLEIIQYADESPIPGFLVPGYVPGTVAA